MSERAGARDFSAVVLSTVAAAAERPAGIALVAEDRELTWTELSQRVGATAGDLIWRGALQTGAGAASRGPEATRVVVLGERRLDTVVAVLALVELGVPFAMLHPRWTASERTAVLDALQPRVVVDEEWRASGA